MNKRNISMVAILLVVVSVGVFASSNSNLKGRDFVRLGQLGILSGTLSEEDGEWYLTTTGSEYALHLGNYQVIYPKGIALNEGSRAVVRGFVLDSDISAVTLATDEKRYSFRTAEGIPLWAGKGEIQNQLINQNERPGQGNYRQSVPMMQNRQVSSYPSQGMMQNRQVSYQNSGKGREVFQTGPRGRR